MAEELLTKEELARHLKVGIRTIDRLRKAGLPDFKVGGSIRFKKDEVSFWLEQRNKK
jgi:excisionase family DNA binding protein